MATLPKRIAELYIAKLRESKELTAFQVDLLAKLLEAKRKPSAEEFELIFLAPPAEEVQ